MNRNNFRENSKTKMSAYSSPGLCQFMESRHISIRDTALCSVLRSEEIIAGKSIVDGCRYGHDAEMEWCLIFSRPLSQLRIDDSLHCHLQGAIRERIMDPARKIGGKDCRHIPGRTIIAMHSGPEGGDFGGLKTTLRELTAGKKYARMQLEYVKENMREVVDRTVSSSILVNIQLITCLKHLQKLTLNSECGNSNIVRLHPPSSHGGYLQERWLKYRSALVAITGSSGQDVLGGRIWKQLVSDIITRKEYIKSGTTARLNVFDGKGINIGTSVLEVD